MADSFQVNKSRLLTASRRLRTYNAEFADAAKQVASSAQTLCGQWEGDARNAFAQEQATATSCYAKLHNAMSELAAMLEAAAVKYDNADQEAAKLLQG